MNNNELYHYGVPGMRWGQRKQYPVQGQHPGTKKQQTTTSKPRPKKQQTKPKQQAPKKQEQQQATPQQSSRFKKGLIAAGVALAIIGTFVIARKMGQNSVKLPVEEKTVSKGKSAVDKLKNKKVSKSKIDVRQTREVFQWLPKPPKPTGNFSTNNKALTNQRTQTAKQLAESIKKQNPKAKINYNAINTNNFAKNYARMMKRK